MSAGIASERLYKSVDGRYVAESDPDAAFMVCAAGQPLPDDYDGISVATVNEPVAPEPEPTVDQAGDDDGFSGAVDDEPVNEPEPAPAKKKSAKG